MKNAVRPKNMVLMKSKKGLTPFVNKLVKKQKHLKTKAESTSPAVHETRAAGCSETETQPRDRPGGRSQV